MAKKEKIVPINLVDEMEQAYGDYALAVLVGRAIPALQDGLKPVQRRLLAAMKGLNLNPEGRYMKSARIEGETMGRYHPHGSAYPAMVTIAATYSNNSPLIDGWGCWGSSTDSAAASRYTECKLSAFSWDVLLDDTGIWETRDNYDGSLQEPILLEAKIPVGLINGSSGIGVGFSTSIPPHNLRGVVRAVKNVIDGDVKSAAKNLIPDFPTGCDVVKNDGLVSYLETGRGSLRLRAKMTEEEGQRKKRVLTFTNLPYGTNPERVGSQVKKALDEGKISGVTSLSDLSDRSGDCLQVTVKEGFNPEDLYRCSDLELAFSCNSLWIDGVQPRELSPISVVREWYEWRMKRLVVKFQTEKEGLESRCHILEGLLKALGSIDKVIKLIRTSSSKEEAREKLMAKPLSLSETQANSVLEMRLRQLTNMDSDALQEEMNDSLALIRSLTSLIEDESLRQSYLLNEVEEISKRHGNARRSSTIEVSVSPTHQSRTGSNKVVSKTTLVRYAKVDKKKGLVEKLKKPRGADLVIKDKDKIIILGANGVFKRLPSNFSGPIFDEPTEVLLATSANTDSKEEYLVVFSTAEGELRKMKVLLSDMMKTTSKGKRMVGEGDTILYFGNGGYTLKRKGRGKDILVGLEATKKCAPGQKGIKIGVTSSFTL